MDDLRSTTIAFVESQRQPGPHGLYRFAPSSPAADLYGTCYAVLIRRLLDDEILATERDELAAMINSYQQVRTGMFVDPRVEPVDTAERSWSFLSIEMTHLCLAALAELGVNAPHALRVMRLVGHNPDAVRNWLNQIQWMRLWPPPPHPQCKLRDMADWNGEEILHFGGTLIKAAELCDASGDAVQAMMDWLDDAVDPATGLWGTNHGCSRENALLGAGAIARLYFYSKRSWPHALDMATAVVTKQGSLSQSENLASAWLRCIQCGLTAEAGFNLRGKAPFNCWQQSTLA